MTVYATQGDCRSHLGKHLQAFRTDRPSEWLMDDFIREAEAMQKTIDRLNAMIIEGIGYEDLDNEIQLPQER